MKNTISTLQGRLKLQALELKLMRQKQKNSVRVGLNRETRTICRNVKTVFSENQLRMLGSYKKVKWNENEIAKSLSLVAVSKKAYELVRSIWKIPLPGTSTLRKWVQGFQCEPGFLNSVFVVLTEQSKHLDNYSKLCMIKYDEMNLNGTSSYDLQCDKIYPNYSKVQVVIVTGVIKNWCQPIYYSFDQNMTFNILKTAIAKVQKAGFEVCGVVGDMGGSNQGFLRSMNVSYENPFISNPCNNEKRIHFFADMPHLIKLLRNHLLDQGIYLSENRVIDKEVLEKLIDADSSELKLAPKLGHNILNVSGTERMKVAPAVKLLSKHTAFLAKFVYPDRTYIYEFFNQFDDFFDIFNSQIPVEKLKPLKSGFGMKVEDQISRLKEIYKVIEGMRVLFFSQKSKSFAPKKSMLPFQKGMLMSINSLLNLYEDVKTDYSITYLLTRRLNQDILESIFSIIRSFGRTYDNPSAYEFKNRMKMLLLGSKMKIPTGANVQTCENELLFLCSELLSPFSFDKEEIKAPPIEPDLPSISYTANESQFSGMALFHLAGYIGHVVRQKYKKIFGENTKNCIGRPQFSEWTFEISKGNLFVPNNDLVKMISYCENFFCSLPDKYLVNRCGITDFLTSRVLESQKEFDSDVVKIFFKTRIKIRLKNMNCKENRVKNPKRVRMLCKK